jgi:hypothetical protein
MQCASCRGVDPARPALWHVALPAISPARVGAEADHETEAHKKAIRNDDLANQDEVQSSRSNSRRRARAASPETFFNTLNQKAT